MGPVHCSQDPQISFLNKIFIKNGSHDTIHMFKNYFAIVFSVFSKISGIQYTLDIILGFHFFPNCPLRYCIIQLYVHPCNCLVVRLINWLITCILL